MTQAQTIEAAPNNVAQLPAVREAREVRVVTDPIPVLDTARFEHMQRIAVVMAKSALIPESLYTVKGTDNKPELLPTERISANCFLIVNQAVRWNMDPFAVAQCVSVVHGRLCYEGKLIAAVIEAKLGIRLRYAWNNKNGDDLGITVSGTFPDGTTETVEGTVGEWKTTSSGSPWTAKQSRKMLAYRGAREWCRLHAPGLMLGIYSDDELEDLSDAARATRARDVTPPQHVPSPPAAPKLAAPPAPPHDPDTGEVWDDEPATETVPSAPPPVDLDGIPPMLDRRPPKAAPAAATAEPPLDSAQWRRDAEGALSGCEETSELFKAREEIIKPAHGKVAQEDWEAVALLYKQTFDRVTGVA